ncbi:MAG TPA: SoxR reducing system RseC family protein [Methylotenera sp.]|nr:SoxR reducing system RseC family protein [Methylotenera sp.]HPH05277.1 SoxR reducing system RseC family protein [Methylotenera sp.]HPN00179.1 SoxR reducing system RseC family protein [Methylotenera sp.]
MLEEYAVVTACQGNEATLELERRTACGLCGQKRGCGNATWGKLLGHNSHNFTAQNTVNAQVGDSVVVGIEENAVLKTSFLLYGVPLLGLIVGTVVANAIFANQFYVMIGAALGLFVSFMWVKGHLTGHTHAGKSYQQSFQAKILRFAENDANAACKS